MESNEEIKNDFVGQITTENGAEIYFSARIVRYRNPSEEVFEKDVRGNVIKLLQI